MTARATAIAAIASHTVASTESYQEDGGADIYGAYVFNDELLTPIRKHELGDSAGVLGAALLT